MKLARTITTTEGIYINLEDMRQSLRDDEELLTECAAMLKVAHDKEKPWQEAVRHCIGNFIIRHGKVKLPGC